MLAIDDRYIARALEKVYEGVLTGQGHPSGIDYLEKIIQLPYRMRPIGPEGLEGYLKSQIDLEEVQESISKQNNSHPVQQTQVTSEESKPIQLTDQDLEPSENSNQQVMTTEIASDVRDASESFNSEFVPDAEGKAILTNADSPQKISPEPLTEAVLTENIAFPILVKYRSRSEIAI